MSATACRNCDATLVTRAAWRAMTPAERDQKRRDGVHPHLGRSLCTRCYYRALKAGRLDDYERAVVPREVVLTEMRHLFGAVNDLSQRRRVELGAPALGMTPTALERALVRANREAS